MAFDTLYSYEPTTRRQKYDYLMAQLKNDRYSYETVWRDISDYLLPSRSIWLTSDTNRGDRRNLKILDSTGTLAMRTLSSGMMAGVTSPARPWFQLTVPDPMLAEIGRVKDWLSDVEDRMSTIFLRSNLYNALPLVYDDLGGFGTSAVLMEEDFETIVRFTVLPLGSYYLSANERGKVETLAREFRISVRNVVHKFANRNKNGEIKWDNISEYVKNAYEKAYYEAMVDIYHVVQYNEDYDPNSNLSKHKKYISAYWEVGASTNGEGNYRKSDEQDIMLRESGFDFFPVLCPRWKVRAGDSYGTDSPGITVLGDVKQLQSMVRRKSMAVEKGINPPLTAPTSLKQAKISMLPGDVTYVDVREGLQGVRAAHEVRLGVADLRLDIQETQQLIRRGLFEDLFLMLSSSDRRQITAREIEERHEEKLLAVGPVLERINEDLLDPLIDATFYYMSQQGLLPDPPDELRGVPLKVEYVSVMAQAQKTVDISGIERFTTFALQTMQVAPEVKDKIDFDQLSDVYGDRLSIPTGIIRSDEDVEAIRMEKAKAAQQQAMAQMMQQGSQAAKNLSETSLEGDNALTRMVGGGA